MKTPGICASSANNLIFSIADERAHDVPSNVTLPIPTSLPLSIPRAQDMLVSQLGGIPFDVGEEARCAGKVRIGILRAQSQALIRDYRQVSDAVEVLLTRCPISLIQNDKFAPITKRVLVSKRLWGRQN